VHGCVHGQACACRTSCDLKKKCKCGEYAEYDVCVPQCAFVRACLRVRERVLVFVCACALMCACV
jgi:hypothetical protein